MVAGWIERAPYGCGTICGTRELRSVASGTRRMPGPAGGRRMILDQPWTGLSGRIGVYAGSGADVYHGLELCAVAVGVGLDVSVVSSRTARSAVPDEVWLSAGGCRDVAADEQVPADHFRSRGVAAIVAPCFDPGPDGARVARLAAGCLPWRSSRWASAVARGSAARRSRTGCAVRRPRSRRRGTRRRLRGAGV